VDNDNIFSYPFEHISHLNITGSYSTARTPHYTIIFRHIFERGHATKREALLAYQRYATHGIKTRLGIALKPDVTSDLLIVVTKMDNQQDD
jgi:hypothetical protein